MFKKCLFDKDTAKFCRQFSPKNNNKAKDYSTDENTYHEHF